MHLYVRLRRAARNLGMGKESCLRREEELKALVREGWPIEAVTRWHWCVAGFLHIWPAAGRWRNDAAGTAGRINGATVRELVAANT